MPIEFHRDGPWDVPQGWVWVALRHLVTLRGEKSAPDKNSPFAFVGMDDVPSNSLRIETKGAFKAMKSAGNKFYPGDVLYGRLRPYLNKAVVADFEGVASGEFIVMRPKEGIDAHYLQLWMHTRKFVNGATRDTSGDRPRIDFDKIADLDLALPPTAEQRRIVARIDELFTKIADGETALTRARDDLDIWRRTLLRAAVTGKLTRGWREHNQPNETGAELVIRFRSTRPRVGSTQRGWFPSDSKKIPDIPDTWAWCAVEEAGEVQLGRQRAPQHHAGKNMRPYLRVANVFEDALDLSDVKSMNFTPKEFETFALKAGDILLNEGQTPDLLGRPAIYNNEIDGCCFQKTLLRFRSQKGILPQFALIVFRHYMRSGRFKHEARITTNMAHLTQVRFVVIEFPVPPTSEQAEIVRRFYLLDGEASDPFELVGSLTITGLRQSVLKAAFEGRLVEQDPRDEPADVLLAGLHESAAKADPDPSRAACA
jgi:type I restriction enzyme S subunit